MSIRRFEQQMGARESVEKNLKAHGYESPQEVIDSQKETREHIESVIEDKRNFDRLYIYLGSDRQIDRQKIEEFNRKKDSLERLKCLASMNTAEAVEAIHDYGLTPNAYRYLADRLEFYQNFIDGKATKKVNVKEWDDKKEQYVDIVIEEIIDPLYANPEAIRAGVLRDLYYAAMQGTPEMGAVKIATKKINAEIERKKQTEGASSRSSQNPVRSVVEFHGYDSGIFQGSLGQYPDLNQLYKDCRQEINKRFADKHLDEKELEHKAVLLTVRRLEGAFNYNGTLNTSASPYNAGFRESVIVGQLGHRVMRQMRGMRSRIQETNFRNVERFIGKSGDNRYQAEKKRLDVEVKALEDFVQDNTNYDASYLPIKQGGEERQVKGKEAAELMTKQKNEEAIERAKRWFEREMEKINRWFEKSKIKIAGYDISEAERDTISTNVQRRYEEKVAYLQREYQDEIERLETRTPEVLLEALQERQGIVNRRFEKRKSLAQKALDLHFRFNHEGRDYGSKPFNQIDWVNNAPFGVIKRAHRLLSAGKDDQTIMMRALAEVNGESPDDQNPEKFVLNVIKSGGAHQVIQNFEKFSGVTAEQHLSILLELIKNGARRDVADNLEKFTGITPENHIQIVHAMNASGAGEIVVSNLEKFTGIKQEDKREILLGAIKGGGGYQLAQKLERFSDVFSDKDHREIVMEMIKAGNTYYLNYNLEKFTGLDEALRQVIKAGKYEALPQVLEAGFTIEDITRFPFLISPLIAKKH